MLEYVILQKALDPSTLKCSEIHSVRFGILGREKSQKRRDRPGGNGVKAVLGPWLYSPTGTAPKSCILLSVRIRKCCT